MVNSEFEYLISKYNERILELEDRVRVLSRAVVFFRDKKNLYKEQLDKALRKEI